MKRFCLIVGSMMMLAVSSSGCALCTSCDDYTYGYLGGRYERHDSQFGRVGSAFADAGGRSWVETAPATPGPTTSEPPAAEDTTAADEPAAAESVSLATYIE